MKTAISATRLAIAAFVIPFVFAYSPSMLLIDATAMDIVTMSISAVLGMIGIAAGLSGYLAAEMNIVERLVALVGGLLLIIPGWTPDLIGFVLMVLLFVLQIVVKKRTAKT